MYNCISILVIIHAEGMSLQSYWGGSEGYEFVGEEVAGGFFADDGVPKHGGDAVAWTLDCEVFFCQEFAFGYRAGGYDAFACYFDVGTLRICH